MEFRAEAVACLVLTILVLPERGTAQTEGNTTTVDIANLLGTSTALYILIGIAALYFLISLTCILLVVCTCYTNHKKAGRRVKNQYEYEELKGNTPPSSALEPVPEVVTSDVESRSLSSLSDDGSDLLESKTEISTIFSNKLAEEVFLAENKTNLQQHCDSPLATYSPKMSPTPHSDVTVPFSDAFNPQPLRTSHAPRHSPITRLPDARSKSPRFKRKEPLVGEHVEVESAAVRRVKSDSPAHSLGRTGSHSPRGDSHKTPPVGGVARVRSDSTPKSSPFRRRKDPSREVASNTTAGSYSPKRSPPGAITATKQLPPSKHQHTRKTGLPGNNERVTLIRLIRELKQASTKWHSIGTQFEISPIVLDTINTVNDGQPEQCIAKICEEWLRGRKDRTWKEVTEVLVSSEVFERDLADSIHMMYCGGHLPQQEGGGHLRQKDEREGGDDTNVVSWID